MLTKVFKDVFKKKEQIAPPQNLDQTPPAMDMDRIRQIEAKANSGDLAGAELICAGLRADFPLDDGLAIMQYEIHRRLAEHRFPGMQYSEWLAWFHQHLKPKNYFEIGVETGQSIQYAEAPTRAVGVDPGINITVAPKTWIKLFKLTSDDFFEKHTPSEVFGDGDIDLAFIDGLHTFDQTLRDFVNVEQHAGPQGVVLIHDIFPIAEVCAARERDSRLWVGDTWKMMMLLRKHRPDLHIFTIPTFPSGLGVVIRLNAKDQTLRNNLDSLYQEAETYTFQSYFPEMERHLNIVPNDPAAVSELLENDGVRIFK